MINIKNNHINEIGALILFATYYYVFSMNTNNESYMDSKYWLGLKNNPHAGPNPNTIRDWIYCLVHFGSQ